MKSRLSVLACLGVALAPGAVSSQTTSPVAYVYVSTVNGTLPSSGAGTGTIYAFSAASNGKLTPVAGSPFADSATSMAVNGKYLFAVNQNFVNLDAYLIGSNGSLKKTATTNDVKATNDPGCVNVQSVLLDHSGANLYVAAGDQECDQSPSEQAFSIVKASGALTYLDTIGPNAGQPFTTTFTANNVYGYGADCDNYGGTNFLVVKRGTNGSLSPISATTPAPVDQSGYSFCPSVPQADPANHLAVAESGFNLNSDQYTGANDQIASYTVDGSGNLTTTSTYKNMPSTAVATIQNMSMSPSGKLLAVGGTKGLQIFHFNGASPVTVDTGLLTSSSISQLYWDTANHLYAISKTAQKLYVYTVTATSAVAAPGSPYTVKNASNLIVQPK